MKGVRGLLASMKELFTPIKNGISKRTYGANRSIRKDSIFYAEREATI